MSGTSQTDPMARQRIERDARRATLIRAWLLSERVVVAAGAIFCLVVAVIAATGGFWLHCALNVSIGVFVAYVAAGMRIPK